MGAMDGNCTKGELVPCCRTQQATCTWNKNVSSPSHDDEMIKQSIKDSFDEIDTKTNT